MADDHGDSGEKHVHGSMDIKVQQETFDAFLYWVGRGMVFCIVALILLYLVNG